jgi:hypothetical protein
LPFLDSEPCEKTQLSRAKETAYPTNISNISFFISGRCFSSSLCKSPKFGKQVDCPLPSSERRRYSALTHASTSGWLAPGDVELEDEAELLEVDMSATETPSQYPEVAVVFVVAFDFPFHCEGVAAAAAFAAFAAAFFAFVFVMACWIGEGYKQQNGVSLTWYQEW